MLHPYLCVNIKRGDKEAVIPLSEYLSACLQILKYMRYVINNDICFYVRLLGRVYVISCGHPHIAI